MSAEIFQFSTAPKRLEKINTSTRVGEDIGDNLPAEIVFGRTGRPLPPPATETAANSRMRADRKDAWSFAQREADYWLARADWSNQLRSAQERGIGDSASFPNEANSRIALLEIWREKLARLLVLPAPDRAAVEWKRAKLRDLRCIPIKAERVERAIAEDEAFLAAHPTKRMDPAKLTARRTFKAAARQRIRDVAAKLGLSDEQIKPALSLRHRAIAEFIREHSVSVGWLLEGSVPMLRGDPTSTITPGAQPATADGSRPKAEAVTDRQLFRDRHHWVADLYCVPRHQ